MLLVQKLDQFPLRKLKLYDIDPERQDKVAKFCEILLKERAPEVEFEATTDPETAFTDVDFVMAQIRVGRMPMREQDEKVPLSCNVVGQETCGPGGMAYGLRSIPNVIKILDYMEKYSPNAWMLNYSNPIAIVAEACRKFRPNSKIINICDMPLGITRSLAGFLGMDEKDLDIRYYGLNHYGWFTDIRDPQGNDLMEPLKKHVSQYGFGPSPEHEDDPDWAEREESWKETFRKVKDVYAVDPTTIPNNYLKYYLYPNYVVEHSDKNYTRANEVMDGREHDIFTECARVAKEGSAKDTTIEADDHADYIVELAHALAYNTKETMIINVPNEGAITNLPDDMVIELPCIISSRGYERIGIGEIPTYQQGMMMQQVCVEKLVVEAFEENSYHKMWQAFSLSATIPNAEVAKEVLDKLIEANKDYWPELK